MIDAGETWPTKSWSSQRGTARAAVDGRVAVDDAGRGDDAAEAAVRPEVAGERPGVDAGDRRDPLVAQERGELAGVVERRRRSRWRRRAPRSHGRIDWSSSSSRP